VSPESTELVSATTLIKDALGLSKGIEIHGKQAVAGAAFDNYKKLGRYVEDNDRDDAIDWLLKQQWEGLQSANNRGTEIHTVAENLHLGTVVEYDEFLEPWIVQYRRFLEEFEPQFLMAEAPVYNLTWRYAGTLDGIAVIDGKTVVVDIKTTAHGPNAKDKRGKPKARPPFSEVPLQLTLYRRAELVGLLADRKEIQYRRYYVFDPAAQAEPMPETEGGVCIVVSPEDYRVVPVDTSERIWKVCRHVIQVAKYQTETSKAVFGPAITPTKKEIAA
jgi:hypothetical protein